MHHSHTARNILGLQLLGNVDAGLDAGILTAMGAAGNDNRLSRFCAVDQRNRHFNRRAANLQIAVPGAALSVPTVNKSDIYASSTR